MNLIADYNSSNETEGSNSPKESSLQKNTKLAKKLKSILFLPAEIQDALARDDSESDSENENKFRIKFGNKNDLLSILPTAKKTDHKNEFIKSFKTSVTSKEIKQNTQKLNGKKVLLPHREEIDEQNEPTDIASIENVKREIEKRMNDKKPLFKLSSDKIKLNNVSVATKHSIATNKCQNYEESAENSQFMAVESVESCGYAATAATTLQNDLSESNAGFNEFGIESTKSQRRNIRNVERMLLSGSISEEALNFGSIPVTNYTAKDPSDFNPYAEGAATNIARGVPISDVHTQMYNPATGETEIVRSVSRGAKRKHHINSLASEAVSRELELMEKRGAALRSKAQTNAKYGW